MIDEKRAANMIASLEHNVTNWGDDRPLHSFAFTQPEMRRIIEALRARGQRDQLQQAVDLLRQLNADHEWHSRNYVLRVRLEAFLASLEKP